MRANQILSFEVLFLMLNEERAKTENAYWDNKFQLPIRARLPSKLNVDVLNLTRLLKTHVRPSNRYIEIGCAPGKMLAWVVSVLKAEATGLDYSGPGIAKCRRLFNKLGLKVNLYHENFLDHHIPLSTFDVVSSFGLIEHFDDARLAVKIHLTLAKPGGLVLITIPNYQGIYGLLQRWCDAPNLELHNLNVMTPSALTALVDSKNVKSVRAYHFGTMSPFLVNFDKRMCRFLAEIIYLGINAIGLLQPLTIKAIAPLLVLEIRKGPIA